MSPADDPWYRLARAPTPADERCRCAARRAVVLCDTLGPNPLLCLDCRGEVSPGSLPVPDAEARRVADALADWHRVHGALYRLWLDSAEYEAFAAAELRHPGSAVNRRGEAARRELDAFVPSYIYLFDADAVEPASPPTCRLCPRCAGRPLAPRGRFLVCDDCHAALG